MNSTITPSQIYEFLSGARVFAKAVRDVIEGDVLLEVAGPRLSIPMLKLLFLVAHADQVTIADAAEFLGVSNPAASKTVEKLVRRRLLRRYDIQGNRRSSHLSLTESSRRLLETYETARNRKATEIFSQYSPDLLQHTAELLDHLACGIACQRTSLQPGAACMQCEIYYREDCRFGDLCGNECFYQLHQKEQQGQPAAGVDEPDEKKEA